MRTSIMENVSCISTIRDELVKRTRASVKRAQFIARDQCGSILGQMTARRHQAMGVKKFKWSTSKDERVRDSHEKLEGIVFEYTNPPAVGLPGADYQCRCTANPVFDDD
ncbi:MAG TPA: minor capsid protein [Chondromyces sp.]|nr:minor capsid protein [Chondromyces sp.]